MAANYPRYGKQSMLQGHRGNAAAWPRRHGRLLGLTPAATLRIIDVMAALHLSPSVLCMPAGLLKSAPLQVALRECEGAAVYQSLAGTPQRAFSSEESARPDLSIPNKRGQSDVCLQVSGRAGRWLNERAARSTRKNADNDALAVKRRLRRRGGFFSLKADAFAKRTALKISRRHIPSAELMRVMSSCASAVEGRKLNKREYDCRA